MNSPGVTDRWELAPWPRRLFAVGVFALAACALGAVQNPALFFRAYLAAYLFYLGIALGSMVLLMVYHLTGGSWGLLLRRILEAAMRTLPLVAVLFLPIACGLGYLYPWAQPERVAASPKLQYQQFYLCPTYFWIRAAVYFAVWMTIAFLLSSWSRRQDQTGQARLARKSRRLSAYGAVAYGVSIHFASVDWAMSLLPTFHSTIWGPLLASGQLLTALSFGLVVLACLIGRPPLMEVASLKVRNDLGSLLFTLLVLWAYLAWFQFMLIWIANLPVDVVWYVPRLGGGWKVVIWTVVALNFVIPFFLLLVRRVKRNSTAVAWIAGLILLMQLVFAYYLVMPGVPGGVGAGLFAEGLTSCWMCVLAPVGVGGIWLAHFLWQLGRRPLLAPHDDNRRAALHLRQLDDEAAAREEALAYG